MKKIVLLTGNSFSRIPAGVEHFSELLKQVFPKLQIMAFDQLHQKTLPFLAEPLKARAVWQYLQNQLHSLNPEIVFFNGMYGFFLPPKTDFFKLGICHGTYSSFAAQAMPWGLDRLRTKFIYSWFERKSLQNAESIISNSEFTRDILKKDYSLNSRIVPFAIDFSVFKPQSREKARKETRLPLGKKIILFVGRPDYSKGFDMLEKLALKNPDWHFVAVTFPRAHSSSVDCRGPFDSKTISLYYAAADIVLFPSRFESFGFVTLEALACNRPVVTTNFGVAKQLNHPACVIAKEYSVSSLQDALDNALKKEFVFDGLLEKEFGIQRFAKQFKETVELFLNETKRGT